MLEHTVHVFAETAAAFVIRPHVRVEVHARAVPPAEERLVGLRLPLDEVDRRVGGLVVDRLHPLFRERAGVLDRLLADLAEARVDGRIVPVAGGALEHAARSELGLERRILRIVGVLGLFLGIEVIEVAEELIEAVHRRQELVAVAEMVLAELAGGVAERLQRLGDGDVLRLQAERGARQADFGVPVRRPDWPVMKDGAARRAALLGVVVGEHQAFAGDAVDVRASCMPIMPNE